MKRGLTRAEKVGVFASNANFKGRGRQLKFIPKRDKFWLNFDFWQKMSMKGFTNFIVPWPLYKLIQYLQINIPCDGHRFGKHLTILS